MKQKLAFLCLFLLNVSPVLGGYSRTAAAKGRTETECILALGKNLVAAAAWDKNVAFEKAVYWNTAGLPMNHEKNIRNYTIYANGKGELEGASFKLQVRAKWERPDCTEQETFVEFVEQTDAVLFRRKDSWQELEVKSTQTEFLKFLRSDALPTEAFLKERGFEPPKVAKANPDSVTQTNVGIGLATVTTGSALTFLRTTPKSSVGRQVLKKVVAPLLIVEGGVRIYDATHGYEPQPVAIWGPISRLPLLFSERGVLRLPDSYEDQLDEKKK